MSVIELSNIICNDSIFRDEDPEKLSKSDDGSAVAVSAQAPPTMPHVPITTPPPPVMGTDMSAQAGYGAYSSWYQVGFRILSQMATLKNRLKKKSINEAICLKNDLIRTLSGL